MFRSEYEDESVLLGLEILHHLLRSMGRVIVQNHTDLRILRVFLVEYVQEIDEIPARMGSADQRDHGAVVQIQTCQEGQRPMSDVLVITGHACVALFRIGHEVRCRSFENLDPGLLIEGECGHIRFLTGIYRDLYLLVENQQPVHLLLELRVPVLQIIRDSVRFDLHLIQDVMNCGFGDIPEIRVMIFDAVIPYVSAEKFDGPQLLAVSEIHRFATCQVGDVRLVVAVYHARPPGSGKVVQSFDGTERTAFLHRLLDNEPVDTELLGDVRVRDTVFIHQHDLGTGHSTELFRAAVRHLMQFCTFFVRQNQFE